MADYKPYQEMNSRFAKVLEDISKTWPTKDIGLVQELVSHSEYGEAMECLLALGLQNGKGFTAGQSAALAQMCQALGLDMPPAGANTSSPAVSRPGGLAAKRAPYPG